MRDFSRKKLLSPAWSSFEQNYLRNYMYFEGGGDCARVHKIIIVDRVQLYLHSPPYQHEVQENKQTKLKLTLAKIHGSSL